MTRHWHPTGIIDSTPDSPMSCTIILGEKAYSDIDAGRETLPCSRSVGGENECVACVCVCVCVLLASPLNCSRSPHTGD